MFSQSPKHDVSASSRLRVRQSCLAFVALSAIWALLLTVTATAQDGSLLSVPPLGPKQQPALNLDNTSFIYRRLPPEAEQRELQLNDIVKVVVDYKAVLQSIGDANSKKTADYSAVLSDWLKFTGKNIIPAPQSHGDPMVAGALDSEFKTQADVKQNDALTFTIAAKVVDIRPNGNLVIEGRSEIQNDDEVWEQSLTGVVRRQSIGPDRTVRGDDVAERRILIRKKGFVRDATKRGWFQKWWKQVDPF